MGMAKSAAKQALCLAVAMGFLPLFGTAAYANETYEVEIAGTPVTSDNAEDVLGDGAVSYDAASNTLTIKGNVAATDTIAVFASTDADFKVVVEDGVAIASEEMSGIAYMGEGVLSVVGGSIAIEAGGHGILGQYDVFVDCESLEISAGAWCQGVYSPEGSLEIEAEDVFIEADGYGVAASGDVFIRCDSLEVASKGGCGIYSETGAIGVIANEADVRALTATDDYGEYSALYFATDVVFDSGVTVTAAAEPDGVFVGYVKADNATYRHVKIASADSGGGESGDESDDGDGSAEKGDESSGEGEGEKGGASNTLEPSDGSGSDGYVALAPTGDALPFASPLVAVAVVAAAAGAAALVLRRRDTRCRLCARP